MGVWWQIVIIVGIHKKALDDRVISNGRLILAQLLCFDDHDLFIQPYKEVSVLLLVISRLR